MILYYQEYRQYIVGTYKCHWTGLSNFIPLLHPISQNKTPRLENDERIVATLSF